MDIVQILIFIGVILFIVVKQYKEVADNRPQQKAPAEGPLEGMEDMPGEGTEMPPLMENDEEVPPFVKEEKETKLPPFMWAQTEMNTEPMEVKPAKAEQRPHGKATQRTKKKREEKEAEPVHQETEISLNTASDARRAFIYSEIFNRKY